MAAKKRTARKTATRKKTTRKTTPSVKAISEPMTKSQMYSAIAEKTGLTRKDVSAVFDELTNIINGHIKKRGAGTFTLPGLLKITTQKIPARKARKGINPFTGEETVFKARPASIRVKVRALKKLKEMAQ